MEIIAEENLAKTLARVVGSALYLPDHARIDAEILDDGDPDHFGNVKVLTNFVTVRINDQTQKNLDEALDQFDLECDTIVRKPEGLVIDAWEQSRHENDRPDDMKVKKALADAWEDTDIPQGVFARILENEAVMYGEAPEMAADPKRFG